MSTCVLLSVVGLVVKGLKGSRTLGTSKLGGLASIVTSMTMLVKLEVSRGPTSRGRGCKRLETRAVTSLITSLVVLAINLRMIVSSFEGLCGPIRREPSLCAKTITLFDSLFVCLICECGLGLSGEVKDGTLCSTTRSGHSSTLMDVNTTVKVTNTRLKLG